MRSKTLLVIAIAATMTLSGCLAAADDLVDDELLAYGESNDAGTASTVPDATDTLEAADDPLWENPQTYPHPAFDWPTVTNPADGQDAPKWWEPIPERDIPANPSSLEGVGETGDEDPSGAGIALFGSLAIVPSWDDQTAIHDISNPEDPKLLSTFGDVDHRDADTIAYPDGRLVAVFASEAKNRVHVWNVTDPENPEKLGSIKPEDGTHNVGIVPGTPYLYNSNSMGGKTDDAALDPGNGEGIIEIYDLSDPEEPKLVENFGNGYGCHDISFRVTDEEQRAYCAGIEYTQIIDVSDVENPEVITSIPVHHGVQDAPSASASPARFSHLALPSADGETLVVGDETGGGLAPACDAHATAGGQTVSGPVGNLYFYDISDEESPEYKSQLSPNHHYASNPPTGDEGGFGAAGCTAHFGRIVPSEEGQHLAMSWYGAGVTLIDFTDPSAPTIEEQWNPNTNTWDVWYYNGYLVTGDLSRGMDVLEVK
jgi:hypothetical protein